MLPNNADALALDDNHAIAIDALPQKSATLTLDDNYDIDTLPNNTDALALNNHAIDALLQQSETLTLGDDASQSSKLQLLHNTNVFPLDSPSQSPEFQLQSTLHNNTIEMLLQNMDALSLDNDPFQSQSQHIPHDDTINNLLQKFQVFTLDDSPNHSLGPRHLHCNTPYVMTPPSYYEILHLLLTIVVLSPRNFDYDTPYTTMLSIPYLEMWNLLFSTALPRSRQNFRQNTPH